ncbi:MAG: DMT family transporter [Bacillota bacterium]
MNATSTKPIDENETPTTENNHTNPIKMIVFALGTILLWGSAFVFSKLIQGQFDPLSISFLRCAISAIFLLILGRVYHIRKPKNRHLVLFASGGLTGFSLYMIAFNSGLFTITAATSSIIIATVPIFTAIAATFIYKEHISFLGWIAIFTAFSGVLILLLWDGILSINIGITYTFFAVAMFCTYNLINRKLILLGYTALEITTYCMTFGAIFLAVVSPQAIAELTSASPFSCLVLLYLSIFCSASAYLLWGRAMYYAKKTSDVTNFLFLVPFVSTILGLFILKETPNLGTILGGLTIVISMYAFQKVNHPTANNQEE